jgi:hypothetical protein
MSSGRLRSNILRIFLICMSRLTAIDLATKPKLGLRCEKREQGAFLSDNFRGLNLRKALQPCAFYTPDSANCDRKLMRRSKHVDKLNRPLFLVRFQTISVRSQSASIYFAPDPYFHPYLCWHTIFPLTPMPRMRPLTYGRYI